jgi:hypothetical protein
MEVVLEDTCSPSQTTPQSSTLASNNYRRALELAQANVANRPTRRAGKQVQTLALNADEAAVATDRSVNRRVHQNRRRCQSRAATRRVITGWAD